jgi:hypothetical protein
MSTYGHLDAFVVRQPSGSYEVGTGWTNIVVVEHKRPVAYRISGIRVHFMGVKESFQLLPIHTVIY